MEPPITASCLCARPLDDPREEGLRQLGGPLRRLYGRRGWPTEEIAAHYGVRAPRELPPCSWDEWERGLKRPLDELAAETSPAESTATFPIEDRAVRVIVIAAGHGFEHRLRVALGERRVAPVTVRSHEGLQHALGAATPALFVVDAQDFPAIDPVRLLAAAESLPVTTTCVLWGAELPYGRSLLRAIEAQARPWTTLALREGIDPLLDLVRSRGRSRRA